jgi:hypothetical protein
LSKTSFRHWTRRRELDRATLPVDVGALHAQVRDRAAQMTGERAQLAGTPAEIDKLRLIIARLQRTHFGRPSEQIDNEQRPWAWKISIPNLQPRSM